MLIRRLGCTTSSFIKASRSLPPARISVSSQLAPRRLTACCTLVALAYSNGRMASLLSGSGSFKGREDPIGSERQERHPHSDRVGDGVGDHRAGRDDGWLAQPDHAALVVAGPRHHVHNELANVTDP